MNSFWSFWRTSGDAILRCTVLRWPRVGRYERREIQIGEGEGLTSGTSVHSTIKLGAYAGRFNNLSLAGMNNPSPNLTTAYLDTPIVGLPPKPLEYIPSPGRLGQPHGYPLISTGGGPSKGGFIRCPPNPPPPYSTHPRLHPPTGQAKPRRVMQPATVHAKTFGNLATRGEPLAKFWPQGSERPNPPTHAHRHRGGGQGGDLRPSGGCNGPR